MPIWSQVLNTQYFYPLQQFIWKLNLAFLLVDEHGKSSSDCKTKWKNCLKNNDWKLVVRYVGEIQFTNSFAMPMLYLYLSKKEKKNPTTRCYKILNRQTGFLFSSFPSQFQEYSLSLVNIIRFINLKGSQDEMQRKTFNLSG